MINSLFDRIFIINLGRAIVRREKIQTEFAKFGVTNYEFFTAIDGNDVSVSDLLKSGKLTDPDLGRGEIGCALSHEAVWQATLDRGYRKVLICEDDIIVTRTALRYLSEVYKHIPRGWDIIHFFSTLRKSRERINPFVWKASNEYGGAVCYAINRRCATGLLESGKIITKALDGVTASMTKGSSPYVGYVTGNVFQHNNHTRSFIGEFGRKY